MKSSAIILFGKFPREGSVKTRLAKSIGDAKATEFYRRCLSSLFAEAEKLAGDHDIFFCFADPKDAKKVKELVPKSFKLITHATGTDDLPTKITKTFQDVFELGYDKVVIFSTDVPELNSVVMEQSAQSLQTADCVIGPDSDGGYFCLGIRSFSPELLNVTYGTNQGMYQQTLRNVANNQLSSKILPEMSDIDNIDDLLALKKRSPKLWAQHYLDIAPAGIK